MTLTLNSDTETRLRSFAEGQGMAPEQLHDALLSHALEEAEAELQNTLDGLDRSMEDLSAGRWITVAEMHQRLRTCLDDIRKSQNRKVNFWNQSILPSH